MGASTVSCHTVARPDDEALATSYRTVAVVGPPNSGKTTLFNRLTRLRQKVGNFPGVTVEHHTGYVRDAEGHEVALIDLAWRLQSHSQVRRREGRGRCADRANAGHAAARRDHLVLNSTNLHSHLVLAARVIALGHAHAGAAEHGRRAAQAGRSCGRAVAGARSWARRLHW